MNQPPAQWSPQQTLHRGLQLSIQSPPSLVPFQGLAWCFWINVRTGGGTGTVQYAKSVNGAWTTPTTARDGNGVDIQELWPIDARPVLATTVLDSVLHLLYTGYSANVTEQPRPVMTRHLQYIADSDRWIMKAGPVDGSRMTSLGCSMYEGKLRAIWRTSNGRVMTAIYTTTEWLNATQLSVEQADGTGSMAIARLGLSLDVFVYNNNPPNRLLDFSFDKTTGKINETRSYDFASNIPRGNLSAFALADYIWIISHSQLTRDCWIAQSNSKGDLQWQSLMDTYTQVTPAIVAVANKLICVWNDFQLGELRYATRTALPMPDMANWMSALPDNKKITRVTIPGTHDSGAISYVPFVGCQMMDIRTQLNNGIRYFDLRAGYGFTNTATEPKVHHAFYPIFKNNLGPWKWDSIPKYFQGILITDVFKIFYQFLDEHKDEGLVVQIKHDGLGVNPQGVLADTDEEWHTKLSNDIWGKINQGTDSRYWLLESRIPTIGQLRGKIQLLRRFLNIFGPSQGNPNNGPIKNLPVFREKYGIPLLQTWTEAPKKELIAITATNEDPKERIQLQDYFDLQWEQSDDYPSLAAKKFALVKVLLDESSSPNADQDIWFINFSSGVRVVSHQAHTIATGFWHTPWVPIVSPYGVNAELVRYFSQKPTGSFGTIIMDYPEQPPDLIAAIVRTNFSF